MLRRRALYYLEEFDMNPNADSVETDRDERPSRTMSPEGSEGVLPLPTRDAFNTAIETEKPMRSGQSGLRGYESTDAYARRIKSYLVVHAKSSQVGQRLH